MVGRRKKREAMFDFDETEGGEILAQLNPEAATGSSRDYDEAKEELSLNIVDKALLKRASTHAPAPLIDIVSDDDNTDFNVETAHGAIDLEDSEASEEENEKQDLFRVNKHENQEQLTVLIKGEEKGDVVEPTDAMNSVDPNPIDLPENITLRKLLRCPRYFDPPDNSWGRCYNCGEEGHTAAKCSRKCKRPCFLCGSLEHNAKDCSKASCFICKSVCHRAKDCPEKKKHGSQNDEICLKCVKSGHDMFHCGNDYSPEDLKEIQCYICKKFGHLCCFDFLDTGRSEISCYKCGLLGHSGLACTKLRASSQGEATPSSCYKCGEEGHFARKCKVSKKVSTSSLDGSQGGALLTLCYKCGREGHFARECTVSNKRFPSFLESQGDATPLSCYNCRQVGHFARKCSSQGKYSQDKATPNLCRRCGQEGHIARGCRFSNKVSVQLQQRNQGSSAPKDHMDSTGVNSTINSRKSSKRKQYQEPSTPNDHMDSTGLNSPNNSKKSSKRKQYQDTERSATMTRKVKKRGEWESENAGAYKVKTPMNNTGWVSPSTPSNGSGRYMNTQSPWNPHRFQIRDTSQPRFRWNPQRFHSGGTLQHRFPVSRFSNWRGRRNYQRW
ncbi:hypothetical protein SAY86_031937 [Trapa natans]|uniref:CCHC-type domain-containing protein n=1 Tax=Trapa natans TaxID=22666 RepID=A0AAN7R400_TRANT|nr:hypothetical protein SAY86_031937 [Trapa natans]